MQPSNLMDPPKATKKRNKYNAKGEYVDGYYFPSKHEAKRYRRLKILQEMGEVKRFHRQVMFDLPGGIVAKVDFMIIWKDDSISYEDAKGRRLQSFIRNKKQVKAIYGIDIEEV